MPTSNARAVVRDLEENHGRKLAPSYVADMAAAIAAAAGQPIVEQTAHAPQSLPAAVASAALSLDGTCALFCDEGFKQCMVGTIALYDSAGQRLETIYLGQAPQMGKAGFLERLDAEWRRVCQCYPQVRRLGLSDGARDYEPWLAARTDWQILDFYHASGYLAAAAPASRGAKISVPSGSSRPAMHSNMSLVPRNAWRRSLVPRCRLAVARRPPLRP